MKNSNKSSFITGVVLLAVAALFTISLIIQPFNFGVSGSGNQNFLFTMGNFLYTVYGFSSALIPLFLLIVGLSCFASLWTSQKTMRLLTAIFPFFTAVVTEKICRSIMDLGSSDSGLVKIIIALITGAMLVIIEIVGAGWIAEGINQRLFHSPKAAKTSDKQADEIEEIIKEAADDVVTAENIKTEETAVDVETVSEETEVPADEIPVEVVGPTVFDDALSNVAVEEIVVEETAPETADVNEDNLEEENFADMGIESESVEAETEENKDDPFDFEEDLSDLNLNYVKKVSDKDDEDEEPANPATILTQEEYAALTVQEPEEEADELEWPDLPPAPDKLPPEYDEDYVEEVKIQQQKPSPYSRGIALYDEEEQPVENQVEEQEEIAVPENKKYSSQITLDEDFFDVDLNDEHLEEKIEAVENTHIFSQISEQESENFELTNPAASVFSAMDEDIRRSQGAKTNPNVEGVTNLTKDGLSDFFNAQQEENTPHTTEIMGNPPKTSNAVAKKGPYVIPSDLLTAYKDDQYWIIDDATKQASVNLKQTLSEFNIDAEVIGIKKGPVVTMFELLPAPGVKLSKIVALQDNIALSLAAQSVRIVAPIPGKQAVGIEVPNKNRSVVGFREMIEMNLPEWEKMAVPVILGKDILGKAQLIDLVKTPHMLIAGATGSGKSVCVNSLILSILYKRSFKDVKLILVDPKVVELKLYNNIPHLLTPVITEPKKALQALQYCLCEMERRYALLDSMGVRDISSYNQRIKERDICTEKLPYIVVIIDEFADLMATSGKELENIVARLTAMSRAVGIHLVLATQRPSVNVITGLIKANIPSRIAFMVASRTDSNIIIDSVGAEKLLGRGDMLYASAVDPYPVRIQGTFVSDQEVENVVNAVKEYGEPDYIDDEIFVEDDDGDNFELSGNYDEDPLYDQALEIVVQAGKASASYIQRRLKIGYNRAARLVEEMEERGIVGPANGSKPRDIIHLP
ncbi:MAG: cell division protein FtsK [Treponema sp.]|nr:cell division protein FtsK [Treponema sp.]